MGMEYFQKMLLRFFVFSFFLVVTLVSCGDRKGKTSPNTDPAPPLEHPGPPYSDYCQSEIISNDECFYTLPDTADGEVFTGNYNDSSRVNTKGATLGLGVWLCRKGTWYEVHPPICLTCLPGHSLEHCQSELDRLIKERMRSVH